MCRQFYLKHTVKNTNMLLFLLTTTAALQILIFK